MERYSTDYISFLITVANENNISAEVSRRQLFLPTGHIDLRTAFNLLHLSEKYYVFRMNRHFDRLGIKNGSIDFSINNKKKNFLLHQDVALGILTHTAKGLMVHDRGVNDFRGIDDRHSSNIISYKPWKSILERCYDKHWHARKPWYSNAKVVDEWHILSNFDEWYVENYMGKYDPHYYKDYFVNKDVIEGNKIYSPSTCFIVPIELHQMISNMPRTSGDLPVGVRRGKGSLTMYCASLKVGGKHRSVGMFDDVVSAEMAYKKAKWKLIVDVADDYFKQGKVSESFVEACMDRLFKI